jgi:hypothetical protein
MADSQLTLPERSALLALMTRIREVSNAELAGELGFTIEKKVRERLVGLGYIKAWQAGRYRAWMHELTDEGWRRCGEELGSPTPEGAQKATRLQYALTRGFAVFMARSELRVADIFVLEDEPAVSEGEPEVAAVDVTDRIRAAYAELAAEPGAWVSLTRLRREVADVPRGELDTALLRMVREPEVRLNPEFNQKTLTSADRAAGLHMGGAEVHLMSIGRP